MAAGELEPLDTSIVYHTDAGFRVLAGRTLQVASIPVAEADENVAILSVGEYFDLADLKTPVVLVHDGKVVETNIPQVPLTSLSGADALLGSGRMRSAGAGLQLDVSASAVLWRRLRAAEL